jgi:hypothetical protein
MACRFGDGHASSSGAEIGGPIGNQKGEKIAMLASDSLSTQLWHVTPWPSVICIAGMLANCPVKQY